ncbi:MAG: type II toxin-antitoxin system VapC family toxin [Candidatus Bathyarchaeia archaeon]
MKLLFDASSIAETLTQRREDAVNNLAGQTTLDLTIYELGNVVWKESRRRKRTEGETSTIMGYIEQVLGVMDVHRIQIGDMQMIERYAAKLNLSFYDSSYLTAAKALERTLVTEDEQLRRAAKEAGSPCLSANEVDKQP